MFNGCLYFLTYEINRVRSKKMSSIYLKVTIKKADVLKTSIFSVKKIRLPVSFWGAPNHADIIEFQISFNNDLVFYFFIFQIVLDVQFMVMSG